MRVASFGISANAAAKMRRLPAHRHPIGQWVWRVVDDIADFVRTWRRRQRERAQLASLDDRMLRDIGASRADVWEEINKPFWRR